MGPKLRYLALVLAIATLASLITGCGSREETAPGTSVQTAAPNPNEGGGEAVGTGVGKIGTIKKN